MSIAEGAVAAVQNFAYHEALIRVVSREARPWFVAPDVCRVLELKNVSRSLNRLPSGTKGLHSVKTLGGEQNLNIVSEGGLYRLIFTSRTPQAEDFVAWVADEVLPAIRESGHYDAREPAAALPAPDRTGLPDTFLAKVQCIRECRLVFGRAQAQLMWRQLGLPPPPPPPLTEADEARMCLRHLLDAPAVDGQPASIRQALVLALDTDDEAARALLVSAGIRPLPESGAFIVANQARRLAEIFAGTDWAGTFGRILRRLPGVTASGTTRFGRLQQRGTLISEALLDPAM